MIPSGSSPIPPFYYYQAPSPSTSAGSYSVPPKPGPMLGPFQQPMPGTMRRADLPSYADDERIEVRPLEPMANPDVEDQSRCLTISSKPGITPVHVRLDQGAEVPCMITLTGQSRSLERVETERPGTDLVCVIDISGSMSGTKISMVRDSLNFIIENTTPRDRMSLVVFDDVAQRLCPLMVCTEEGRQRLSGLVNALNSRGSTNIQGGLQAGLKVLQDRRVVNQVACLFLLSDGHDTCGGRAFERCRDTLQESLTLIAGGLSLHTFGFGSDHDSQVMSSLAENGQGGFQFVEQTSLISTAFAASFGGVVSLVAREVEVHLTLSPTCPIPCQIKRLYVRSGNDFFSVPGVTSNERKDLIFLLYIAGVELESEVEIVPVTGVVKYVRIDGGREEMEEFEVKVRVAPNREGVAPGDIDEDVHGNWYRVKGAAALHEAQAFADQSRYQDARDLLSSMIEEFAACPLPNNPMVLRMKSDLEACFLRIRDDMSYHSGGSAHMSSLSSNHYYQTSSLTTMAYSSPQQVSYTVRAQTIQQSPPTVSQTVWATVPSHPPSLGIPSGPPRFGPPPVAGGDYSPPDNISSPMGPGIPPNVSPPKFGLPPPKFGLPPLPKFGVVPEPSPALAPAEPAQLPPPEAAPARNPAEGYQPEEQLEEKQAVAKGEMEGKTEEEKEEKEEAKKPTDLE